MVVWALKTINESGLVVLCLAVFLEVSLALYVGIELNLADVETATMDLGEDIPESNFISGDPTSKGGNNENNLQVLIDGYWDASYYMSIHIADVTTTNGKVQLKIKAPRNCHHIGAVRTTEQVFIRPIAKDTFLITASALMPGTREMNLRLSMVAPSQMREWHDGDEIPDGIELPKIVESNFPSGSFNIEYASEFQMSGGWYQTVPLRTACVDLSK
jgi:hypothetical protein